MSEPAERQHAALLSLLGSSPAVPAMDGLAQAVQSALRDVRQKFRDADGEPGLLDSWRAFAAAVDWTEPWLIALLAAEAALLVSVIAFRHRHVFLGLVLVAGGALVRCLEPLNSLARQHWKSFARQNCFDPNGIFMGVIVAAPLLLAMFIALVSFVVDTCRTLVLMKRKQIAYQLRQRQRADTKAAAAGAAGAKKDS